MAAGPLAVVRREVRHFHLFCGLGAGAKGFNRGKARVGNLEATFRCLGGIDVDPAAIADFNRLTGAKGTVIDLFSREQYVAFHGHEPPPGWRPAMPLDIQMAAGGERPHIVFLSAPCKGFSGLLPERTSRTAKYQALNELTLRGIWLMLEAWSDDPPELVVFENVPRIASRGRHLLDQIGALLRRYGYAVAETTHDCGELGGLAQSRKRFLLVARHQEKVPPFLYEPPKRSLRGVGEVLGKFPLPGDMRAGPMHRVPALQWKTWVRLAFVEAGSDWRSLNRLAVKDGYLADYLIVPEMHRGALGVCDWTEAAGTVTARGLPYNGKFAVADPRREAGASEYSQYGVLDWRETSGAVSGQSAAGGGKYSVADPRMPESRNRQNGIYRIVEWNGASGAVTGAAHVAGAAMSVADPRYQWGSGTHQNKMAVVGFEDPAKTVTGSDRVGSGALSVADPRCQANHGSYGVRPWDDPSGAVTGAGRPSTGTFAVADPRRQGPAFGKYAVTDWEEATGTVISGSTTGQGAFAVADPRPGYLRDGRETYRTAGMYGVIPWEGTSGAVQAAGQHDNGTWSVADPRVPDAADRGVYVIRSMDDTWHRPFTTLELAALQSLVDPEEYLELEGLSDAGWRERIGNAVPPGAAEAIASVMGRTLLLAWSGETFVLSSDPIWVRPIAIAASVDTSSSAVWQD